MRRVCLEDVLLMERDECRDTTLLRVIDENLSARSALLSPRGNEELAQSGDLSLKVAHRLRKFRRIKARKNH